MHQASRQPLDIVCVTDADLRRIGSKRRDFWPLVRPDVGIWMIHARPVFRGTGGTIPAMCMRDELGHEYVARADDMIISSATTSSALRLRMFCWSMPLRSSAVVGLPDQERTNIVKAFIVSKMAGRRRR